LLDQCFDKIYADTALARSLGLLPAQDDNAGKAKIFTLDSAGKPSGSGEMTLTPDIGNTNVNFGNQHDNFSDPYKSNKTSNTGLHNNGDIEGVGQKKGGTPSMLPEKWE